MVFNKYTCLSCSNTFYTTWDLSCHIIYWHSTDLSKLFHCHQCDQRFESKNDLKNHHLTHTSDEYVCHFYNCLASFSKYENFISHLFSIHSTKCYYCSEGVSLPHDLDGENYHLSSMADNYFYALSSVQK